MWQTLVMKNNDTITQSTTQFESITTQAGKVHPAFTSPFGSNEEAGQALVNKKDDWSEFETSLLSAQFRAEHGGPELSPARSYWLHKLAMPEQAPTADESIDCKGIREILNKAGETLKKPAITIAVGETKIKISRAGSSSRNPGAIYVASPEYGGAYYGKVDHEGHFFGGRDCKPEVVDFLKKFAADPSGVAAHYGHVSGCCCFCNRSLTDDRSLAVGYGPVCADRYGLNWGSGQTLKWGGEANEQEMV